MLQEKSQQFDFFKRSLHADKSTWVLGLDGLKQPPGDGQTGVGTPVALRVEAHGGPIATTRIIRLLVCA